MTTTNETTSNKLMDLVAIVAVITITLLAGTYFFYGAIISAWLGTMATISIIGAGGAVALGLMGGAGYLGFRAIQGGLGLAWRAQFMREELEQTKAVTAMKWAEVDHKRADTALIAMNAAYQFHSVGGAAILVSNGQATILHLPSQQSAPAMPQLALDSGESELETDSQKLLELFTKAKAIHALILGSRNSGKSTLVNRLINREFAGYQVTIIDILFNQVDSGWLLPDGAKVCRDFVATLKEFYASHKKLVDTVTVSRRGAAKKLLVIDEFPSLLASLKATDKKQYEDVMAMLRSIYSNGSHTNHNVILLSQTVLSEDIGLSSNDKGNFIQVALGSLAGDYLSLRRGKANKKAAYERIAMVASEFDYYALFEDTNGAIDCQPLPDLSDFGAKRLYGMAANEVVEESMVEVETDSTEPVPTTDKIILNFEVVSESDQAIIDAANKLIATNSFSFNKLHFALTGQKQSGGIQNAVYKEILAKYRLLELVTK